MQAGSYGGGNATLAPQNYASAAVPSYTEEFPPLVPMQMTSLTLEERLAKMEVESVHSKEFNIQLAHDFAHSKEEFNIQLGTYRKLLLPFCERELLILAGEILKWAVQKRGEEDGEGLHLFDPSVQANVLLACRVYGGKQAPTAEDMTAFRKMSQKVILLRNSTAHFSDIGALDRMVKMCEDAIDQWPGLANKYPEQVQIVQKYHIFKKKLKDSFQ